MITDCNTAATGELVILNTIGGNPVTSIGTFAFKDCRKLRKEIKQRKLRTPIV